MADTKITALAAITTVAPANDLLPIVDVDDHSMAASGTTKNITVNQILGAGGTATLASATITGALTANGGISMANATAIASSGAVALYVDTNQLVLRARATNGILFQESTGANNLLTISNAGVFGFLDGAGGTRMTLNSSGLTMSTGSLNSQYWYGINATSMISSGSGSWPLLFGINGSEKARIDSSGNLGIGGTPQVWNTSYKGVQVGLGANFYTNAGTPNNGWFATNTYQDVSNQTTFIGTGYGMHYRHLSGEHAWLTSTVSGSAGVAATMNQLMTLTAAGELLVGTTSAGGIFDTKFFLSSNSGTNKWAVGPYGTATNFAIIPTPGTGGVYLSGTSATSWTAYSDERLKDIIEPITNALAKVGSLRSVIGKFKGDEANTRRPFLIAQDLQSALPEAVDASNPDRLGVAYTDVIPLLVAAIKELAAEVNALKNA